MKLKDESQILTKPMNDKSKSRPEYRISNMSTYMETHEFKINHDLYVFISLLPRTFFQLFLKLTRHTLKIEMACMRFKFHYNKSQ